MAEGNPSDPSGSKLEPVQFSPFSSQISPSFWTTLASFKIDRAQLSDDRIEIRAKYTIGKQVKDRSTSEIVRLPTNISLDSSSLETVENENTRGESGGAGESQVEVVGSLKNFNTIEEFKKADKMEILQETANALLISMMQDEDPIPSLNRFLCLSFSDLKKYKFYYWFAYPALLSKPHWHTVGSDWSNVKSTWGEAELQKLSSSLRERSRIVDHGFFLIRPDGSTAKIMEFESFFRDVDQDRRAIGFIDPSALSDTPGWPLRNLLSLLSIRFDVQKIRVVCWRNEVESGSQASQTMQLGDRMLPFTSLPDTPSKPSAVGWERNNSGKLAPKMADLGPLMDPKRLADQAVDLNLKLMRWRILPEINLEKVSSTRCLLLGAGTLGCYVARTLLGWGVRKITLVDSSTVSFSNPVRQPLFEFSDCLEGGKPKAECAANALRRIYPGVEAEGHQINIPMPGHPIPKGNVEQVKKDVESLQDLFDSHDAVYLLMDSRESRWLPTVLGAVKSKMVFNTALGFDTFLAMRHGASPKEHASTSSTRLGCYFCNDVVAPTDSLTDRTLDQMCTVTRPGLASVASATTVEMMVSILQHPLGFRAPAYIAPNASGSKATVPDADSSSSDSILGRLPHQIRGSLFNFQNLLIHGPAYDRCTACSETVIDTYAKEGFEMIQKACNDEEYLRHLTGLDQLYDATDEIEVEWDEEEGSFEDD
ncbi:E1-like protein-activating [Meira miltonrushii]|uniref:Ubiquitin-like modifier-activating enzyme ATG7 n=1 Tax=Meira miltonrushii TaxID=1280837 RepID=A0A316VDN0_9BASI|nr:E1-like protein-activating [Meira miltonrushii]PWN35749.1 E1-like protein-activating [Meira miltonrushii]